MRERLAGRRLHGHDGGGAAEIVENVRAHAPGANIHITGQPFYNAGHTCSISGDSGPELTDQLAREAASDASLNVTYAGTFSLDASTSPSEVSSDTCNALSAGELALGNQAVAKWGL